MTYIEILTIYLAIGAPFAVYYFYKHRDRLAGIGLATKTLLAGLFWFYYAGQLIFKFLISFQDTRRNDDADVSREKQIEIASQNLQNAFPLLADDGHPTFFEFREILERYIGLTLATQNSSADAPAPAHETEVFRIAGHEKRELQLAGRIMHRRNFLRLRTHEHAARHDFLRVTRHLYENISLDEAKLNGKLEAWDSYHINAAQLAELLEDSEVLKVLRKMIEVPQHTADDNGRKERVIWKTWQPSPTNLNPLQRKTASAQAIPTTSSRRD